MAVEKHTLMDGKVHVYRRESSRFWQCSVFLGDRNHRQSTRHTNLAFAVAFAREWFFERYADEKLRQRGIDPTTFEPAVVAATSEAAPAPPRRRRRAAPRRDAAQRSTTQASEKRFKEAAEAFVAEYEALTAGERNAEYVASKARTVRLHLLPFFGNRPLSEVTAGAVQAYRVHRNTPPPEPPRPVRRMILRGGARLREFRPWRKPSRATLHQEIVCLRQILKSANRKGWIPALPDMSAPYKASGKIGRRAWFSPDEFERLHKAVVARAETPKRDRWRGECEQFRDYVEVMVNTGLRPDEASRLEYRDVEVAHDADTDELILEIAVRGKRGVGYCKSLPDAVPAFERLLARHDPAPTDLIFGAVQRELLNAVLAELDLKTDREGKPRTAYSLRHTYICFRLMAGADIYQVAKNCRTSVEMIEKFYAAHIKNTLDAAAINVRKPRKVASAEGAPADA